MAFIPSVSAHVKAFVVGLVLAILGIGIYVQWGPGGSTDLPTVTVYKRPSCGCCGEWVTHLREEGFRVSVEDRVNVGPVKRQLHVPDGLASCHTAIVGNYAVEGHVPARDIKRLLRAKPNLRGVSVPGMPVGSPGMERGDYVEPYSVIGFTSAGDTTVLARYGPQQ